LKKSKNLIWIQVVQKKIAQWALVIISINRNEPKIVNQYLKNMESGCKKIFDIIEPEGPLPFPENWKWYFYSSISQLMLSEYHNAVAFIEKALAIKKRSGITKQFRICLWKNGVSNRCKRFFSASPRVKPEIQRCYSQR
jgi:hypothetical protein